MSENGATPAMVILINDPDPKDLGVPSFQTKQHGEATWDSHFRVENEKNPRIHIALVIGEYHDSDHWRIP